MAVVEPAFRIRNAHHRPPEHLARVAHALRERAAQVQRERGITIVGEPARDTALGLLRHEPSTTGSTQISTRRSSARPPSLALLAIGMASPFPTMLTPTACTLL